MQLANVTFTLYMIQMNCHFLNATVLWILISFVETHWWYCDI